MKRIINVFILVSLVFLSTGYLYAQDKVIAVVNNDIITQKDLADFLNFIRIQYARELTGRALEEKISSLRQDLLQRLIEDRLILQQAKLEKMSIPPARIKAKIDDVRKRYASESDYQQDLAKQGLVPADLETKIGEQLLMFNFVEQKVRGRIIVRPEEVTSYYMQHARDFTKSEERVLMLLIIQDEDSAKALSSQLRAGKNIEDLAKTYDFANEVMTVSAGQQLRPEIEETVFKLGLDEFSTPVKVGTQYFIFKLVKIIGKQQLTMAQAQDKVQGLLFDKKMQEELKKWLDEIKKQSYIKILED